MPGAPVEALRNISLFADLNKRELAQVAREFKERRFPKGEIIIKEGSGGGTFYLIDSGHVTVSIGGRERARLGPGDYFGEMALIDGGARTATVLASSELVCYGLTYWEFRPLVQQNGRIGWKLLERLAQRLRTAPDA